MRGFLLVLICSTSSLFSAGPTLHLWAAERFCAIYGVIDETARQAIIIGTELPDIRYIAHIERDLTHPVVLNVDEIIQSESPLQMGMKLHAWLDVVREDFIAHEVYDAVAPYADGSSATLLKFIEEEILADFYDGRQWSPYLNEVLPEELNFAPEETVWKWHNIVQWTISARPSWLLWAQSYKGHAFGVSANTLYHWSYLLPELKEVPLFQNHLHALLAHIEAKLKETEGFPLIP